MRKEDAALGAMFAWDFDFPWGEISIIGWTASIFGGFVVDRAFMSGPDGAALYLMLVLLHVEGN